MFGDSLQPFLLLWGQRSCWGCAPPIPRKFIYGHTPWHSLVLPLHTVCFQPCSSCEIPAPWSHSRDAPMVGKPLTVAQGNGKTWGKSRGFSCWDRTSGSPWLEAHAIPTGELHPQPPGRLEEPVSEPDKGDGLAVGLRPTAPAPRAAVTQPHLGMPGCHSLLYLERKAESTLDQWCFLFRSAGKQPRLDHRQPGCHLQQGIKCFLQQPLD